MIDLLQLAAQVGGVGALLAVIIFVVYRIDRKSSEKRHLEAWRASEERLSKLIEQDQKGREKNTKALTKLTTLITRLNGRLK